jgi:predicted membrane-bound spermidine synthase
MNPLTIGKAELALLEIVAIWLISMGIASVMSTVVGEPMQVACYVDVQIGPTETVVYQGRGVLDWGS